MQKDGLLVLSQLNMWPDMVLFVHHVADFFFVSSYKFYMLNRGRWGCGYSLWGYGSIASPAAAAVTPGRPSTTSSCPFLCYGWVWFWLWASSSSHTLFQQWEPKALTTALGNFWYRNSKFWTFDFGFSNSFIQHTLSCSTSGKKILGHV